MYVFLKQKYTIYYCKIAITGDNSYIDCVEGVWWIEIRSGRLFSSCRGRFFWKRFSRTNRRSNLAGQILLKPWKKCIRPSKDSSWSGMLSNPSFNQAKPSRTRTCWPQWCISLGNGAMKFSRCGIRTTQSFSRMRNLCARWPPNNMPLPEDGASVEVVTHV